MSLAAKFYHLPAAVHWLRAFYAYERGDVAKALSHYHRFARWRPPAPRREAFKATLNILQHRSKEARRVFQSVIDQLESKGTPSENDRYVLCYSRYYAALIEGDDAERFRLAARETSPERHVSRWLCLPEEPVL